MISHIFIGVNIYNKDTGQFQYQKNNYNKKINVLFYDEALNTLDCNEDIYYDGDNSSYCFEGFDNIYVELYVNDKKEEFKNTLVLNKLGINKVEFRFRASYLHCRDMFKKCTYLTIIDFSYCKFKVSSINSMFKDCHNLKQVKGLNSLDTSDVSNFSEIFSGCYSLKFISGLSYLNTEKATNFKFLFEYCLSLRRVNLAQISVKNVKKAQSMFYNCRNLTGVNLSTKVKGENCGKSGEKLTLNLEDGEVFGGIDNKGVLKLGEGIKVKEGKKLPRRWRIIYV